MTGIAGHGEASDIFGTLGAGNFGSTSNADLAVGVPNEDTVGAVEVIYGGPAGLSAFADDFFGLGFFGATPEGNALFGIALAPSR